MRIDSTEAVSTSVNNSVSVTTATVIRGTDSSTSTKDFKIDTNDEKKIDSKKSEQELDTVSISGMTQTDKRELPVSDKVLIDAIEKANKAILGGNRRFEFSIHQKTKEIMVKVINSDTNETVREIPSEKTLDMVAKMWEMAGIIVDERR